MCGLPRYESPEKGRKTYRPKHWEYNNKDKVNRQNILSDINYQTSSQEVKQIRTETVEPKVANTLLLNTKISQNPSFRYAQKGILFYFMFVSFLDTITEF